MGGCSSHAQDWSWKHPLSLGSRGNLLTINMRIMVHVSYTGSDEGQRLDICYFSLKCRQGLKSSPNKLRKVSVKISNL